MQSNQHTFPHYLVPPADLGGGSHYFTSTPGSSFGGTFLPPGFKPLRPFHGVEVQPSAACPKNFIIFDQSDYRSQIMIHPANSTQFGYNSLTFSTPLFQDNIEACHANNEREAASYQKEDSADIDALLSLESDKGEESEEEEVSTARTDANYGSNSPDSYSNYGSQPKKCRLPSFKKSTASGSSCSGRKYQKMKKMMKALRRIIPGTGTGRMNTVTVLDEAVRHLKSLKVEVQKLGLGNPNGHM